MTIPEDCLYTTTHEWIRQDSDNIVSIGITKHAEELLGDLVFVELPEPNEGVKAGDEIGVVESVKAASDYYTPVSGTIISVNESLEDSPGIVNLDCYHDGWLVKIKLSDVAELEDLLSAQAYADCLSEDA